MALDGVLIKLLTNELSSIVNGSIVTKVSQPSKEEIILTLRKDNRMIPLYISAKSTGARVTVTNLEIENPFTPPMFCMLLRKYLEGAKIIRCCQEGFERIIFFDFEAYDIYGDKCKLTLVCELMGRYSNILLLDNNKKIIECLKRVTEEKSKTRPLLPGLFYEMPIPLKKHLLESDDPLVAGLSPLIVREIGINVKLVRDIIDSNKPFPVILYDKSDNPVDFSYMNINQYKDEYTKKSFCSLCEMLDTFFGQKDLAERMKQKETELLKSLESKIERIQRRISVQLEELQDTKKKDDYLKYANLLSANLYNIKANTNEVSLMDYETNEEVKIKLNPLKSPNQNMQHFYKEYRKADTAEKMLTNLITEGENELDFLKSEYDLLKRSKTEEEVLLIKEELSNLGYIKHNGKKGSKNIKKLPPLKYKSSDGYIILSGRNNIQNDNLTFKEANKNDIWFHVQKMPGSHTIILTNNTEPPARTYTEAAVIAATNSSVENNAKIAVDYTKIKNVKHRPDSKPGMVIYENYFTAYVEPDKELAAKLLIK